MFEMLRQWLIVWETVLFKPQERYLLSSLSPYWVWEGFSPNFKCILASVSRAKSGIVSNYCTPPKHSWKSARVTAEQDVKRAVFSNCYLGTVFYNTINNGISHIQNSNSKPTTCVSIPSFNVPRTLPTWPYLLSKHFCEGWSENTVVIAWRWSRFDPWLHIRSS